MFLEEFIRYKKSFHVSISSNMIKYLYCAKYKLETGSLILDIYKIDFTIDPLLL